MESNKITDSILKAVRNEVKDFVDYQSEITSPIEYEVKVWQIARKMARELIEQSDGQLPKSRNAKKSPNEFW